MSGNSHNEETRNYEMDTTVVHIKHKVGTIDRLAVSVALDYMPTTNEAGEVTYAPRADAEVENLRRLLMGGLGLDKTRGDILEIASVRFNRLDLDVVPEEEFWKTEAICKAIFALVVVCW